MKLITRLFTLILSLAVAVAIYRLMHGYVVSTDPNLASALTYFYDHNLSAVWLLAGCGMATLILLETQYNKSLATFTEWLAVLTGLIVFTLAAFYMAEIWRRGLRIDRMAIGFASLLIVSAILIILFTRGKTNSRGLAVLGIVAVAGVATWWMPALNPVRLSVAQQVWRLQGGQTTLRAFDWGYLNLRSGHYGKEALQALQRPGGRDDIRVAAASVLKYYMRAGQTIGTGGVQMTFAQETLFSAMHEPDAKASPVDLLPGQTLPADLMDDIRFDISPCHSRPTLCKIRLRDANGDGGEPEALIMRWVHVQVFARGKGGWAVAARGSGCLEDEQALIDGKFDFRPQRFDDVMVGGHHMVLQTGDCGLLPWGSFTGGAVSHPFEHVLASKHGLGTTGAEMPLSLSNAIATGQVLADRLSGNNMVWGKEETEPSPPTYVSPNYVALPNCPGEPTKPSCRLLLMDMDHDGENEVLVIDDDLVTDQTHYHPVSLFKFDGRHWHAAAEGKLCEEWGEPAKMTFQTVKPDWLAMHVNGHDMPIGNGGCMGHGIVLH